MDLFNIKGIALLAAAGYFLAKKKANDNAYAESSATPAYLLPAAPEAAQTMPVSLAVPVSQAAPESIAPVSTKEVSTMPVSVPIKLPDPLPAPTSSQVVLPAEDPRIAKRIEIAAKYGADPSQLDLNQPEIEYWDAVNNVVRRQPNYIYKSNQLSLPTVSPAPVQSVSLYAPISTNTPKFGSFRRR